MLIQFLCPNGHKIHCPEDRAGQPAKCPKCGVRFRVPASNGTDATTFSLPQSNGPRVSVANPAPGSMVAQVALGPAATDDEIEFLCPNNHLLHGLASLQGQPGQCPECASKFRIPSYDEEGEETRPHQGVGPMTLEPFPVLRGIGPTATAAEETPAALQLGGSSAIRNGGPHPFLDLVMQFWSSRYQGVSLELHLKSGQRLTPERFLRGLSHESIGVFAVQEPSGTFTLTAVAWTEVSSVVVHGLKKLPDDPVL